MHLSSLLSWFLLFENRIMDISCGCSKVLLIVTSFTTNKSVVHGKIITITGLTGASREAVVKVSGI